MNVIRSFEAYEEAKKRGGALVSGYWHDFDELPVPPGYHENWRVEQLDDWKEYFREQGRLGGQKGGFVTKQKGREYYSRIGKMGGRGKKKVIE